MSGKKISTFYTNFYKNIFLNIRDFYYFISSTHVGQTFQKAKRKMEDKLNKIGLGKGKKKDGVMEEVSGSREFCLLKYH